MRALVSKTSKEAYLIGEDNLIDSLSKLLTTMKSIHVVSTGATTLTRNNKSITAVSIREQNTLSSSNDYYLVDKNIHNLARKEIDEILKKD